MIRHRKCGFLGGFLGPACALISGLNAVLLPSHTLLLHSLLLASTSLSCVGPRAPIWRGECSVPEKGVRFQPILTAFRNSVGDFFACSVLMMEDEHSPLDREQTDRLEYFSAVVQVQIVDQPLSKKEGLRAVRAGLLGLRGCLFFLHPPLWDWGCNSAGRCASGLPRGASDGCFIEHSDIVKVQAGPRPPPQHHPRGCGEGDES